MDAFIVDDEPEAHTALANLLAEHCPEINIIGQAEDIDEAVNFLENNQPDILFLDIKLKSSTGFNLLERLGQRTFKLIFTTAYSEFALKAFKYSAVDYLLKPIYFEDLKEAVARVQQFHAPSDQISQVEVLLDNLRSNTNQKIVLPSARGYLVCKISDIVRCESERNYTSIYFVNRTSYVSSKNIKHFEELLTPHGFFRCHQSFIVNLNLVKQFRLGRNSKLTMEDDSVVELARNKKDAFKKMFLK